MEEKLELSDIQGLLIRGHGRDMGLAAYYLIGIKEPESARAWLKAILPKITPGDQKPMDNRFQIAFTHPGLAKLGMTEITDFRPEFVQGMATAYRARLLGDLGRSASETWQWGGPKNTMPDILLMIFAPDRSSLAAVSSQMEASIETNGMSVIHILDTSENPIGKEHFGFQDGIAQPILAQLKKSGQKENQVPAGEFILGYTNAYNELPDTPLVEATSDPEGVLPEGKNGEKDFGKNGSYMVFRQLKQDVSGFWKFLLAAVKKENPDAGTEECIQLAAKMVGRWPGGAPLTVCPFKDDPEMSKLDDFLYIPEDAEGLRCPAGSHIRRANPRDALPNNKPEKAVKISNRHRILRRGRNFGAPFSPTFDIGEMIAKEDDAELRGLHFICFNTNIAQQFEFVQHTWSDNTKFAALYDDPDPILGIKDTRNKSVTHDFTIPALPVRRKIEGLQRFVHVIGGAYFFMPGLRALQYLSTLNNSETHG